MACSIIATAGSATANSYATVAEADSYHQAHVSPATWDAATSDEKCKALQMATRLLDQRFEWKGVAAGNTQALLWPRVGVVGPKGYLLANDTIPDALKNATAEQARLLLDEDRTVDSEVTTKGISRLVAGPIELEFSGAAASSRPIPDSVAGFLVPFYGTLTGVGGGAVTLLRA